MQGVGAFQCLKGSSRGTLKREMWLDFLLGYFKDKHRKILPVL